MTRVYRSSVNETTRKALLESPHPHPPYLAHAAAEEAAHNGDAEEAAHIVAPLEIEPNTPSDTHTPLDTDTLLKFRLIRLLLIMLLLILC